MTSSIPPDRQYEERLSETAAAYFQSLTEERKARVADLVRSILATPDTDGARTFDLLVPPVAWRVRIEDDYTIYFRVVGYPDDNRWVIEIDAIKETGGSLRDMLQRPF